jgi:hypothetical protein
MCGWIGRPSLAAAPRERAACGGWPRSSARRAHAERPAATAPGRSHQGSRVRDDPQSGACQLGKKAPQSPQPCRTGHPPRPVPAARHAPRYGAERDAVEVGYRRRPLSSSWGSRSRTRQGDVATGTLPVLRATGPRGRSRGCSGRRAPVPSCQLALRRLRRLGQRTTIPQPNLPYRGHSTLPHGPLRIGDAVPDAGRGRPHGLCSAT